MAKMGNFDFDKPWTGGVVPDIAEFRSPIDGSMIGSRPQLAEHEKRHGVKQCGELNTAADFSRPEYKSVIED